MRYLIRLDLAKAVAQMSLFGAHAAPAVGTHEVDVRGHARVTARGVEVVTPHQRTVEAATPSATARFRLTGYALDELVMRAEVRDDELEPDLAPLFDAFDGERLTVTLENAEAVGEALTEISNRCDDWAERAKKQHEPGEGRAQRAATQGLGTLRIKVGRWARDEQARRDALHR